MQICNMWRRDVSEKILYRKASNELRRVRMETKWASEPLGGGAEVFYQLFVRFPYLLKPTTLASGAQRPAEVTVDWTGKGNTVRERVYVVIRSRVAFMKLLNRPVEDEQYFSEVLEARYHSIILALHAVFYNNCLAARVALTSVVLC